MSKKNITNKYQFRVQPELFERPKNLKFLKRINKTINLSAIARMIPSCSHPNTMISRVSRDTELDTTNEQKAFAEETGEVLNEMFWVLGVGLGHFPADPHKKYKYFYQQESERLRDRLADLEEEELTK